MPGPRPKPDAGPKIFVLHYNHRHGDDLGAYASHRAAEEARAALCVEFATEVYVPGDERAEADVAEQIRALHTAGKFDECVQLYLAHRTDETMEIHELEINGLAPIEELIARSSLGSPGAVAIRASADPAAVAKVMARVDELVASDGAAALKALHAIAPYFIPEIRRGPANDDWVRAARLLIAALPDNEIAREVTSILDQCNIPCEESEAGEENT